METMDKVAAGESASTMSQAEEAMDREFFSFPYEPYGIQLDLMRQLYRTLDAGHVGIFESPTGTGKSMSLICGALAWLKRHSDEYGLPQLESKPKEDTDKDTKETTSEPSWLASYEEDAAARAVKTQQTIAQEALKQIEDIRANPELQGKKRKMGIAYNHHERKRSKGAHPVRPASSEKKDGEKNDDEHLVASYDSGADAGGDDSDSDDQSQLSNGARWFMGREEKPQFGVLKIIYCSRTHSQISQFIREIHKTPFSEHIRVVSLGSRKNLCVNETVTSLRSDLRMTDKCLDMLQGSKNKKDKKKKAAKCPYYDKELLGRYKDYALAQVQDIEDLHLLGQEMSICSYYGARESIPLAQVVAMPYAMLLSKDTRESLGIDLKDHIVILDEAHNIIEAINSTYQVMVTNKQLVVSRRSLWAYFKKYEKRFKGKNVFYIKQLLSILEAMTKYLRQAAKNASNSSGAEGDDSTSASIMSINDFVFNAGVDNFNMFKIVQYLNQSELAKKLMGFMDTEQGAAAATSTIETLSSTEDGDEFESRHVSPLRTIEALFKALTNTTKDGRIRVQGHNPSKGSEGSIKFVLLNPANHFQDVVDNARSVVLAGGTMQPVSQVLDQLFPFVPRERIDLFSCGHVIPPENLLGFSLSAGPTQKHLEFTFARRNDMEAIDELGRILLNLTRVVPNGVVVFFPSYRFEESVVKRWMETKQFDEIGAKKTIFREPKQADQLGDVLSRFSAACKPTDAIAKTTGAMLLSVVGGKMSEGINFSDELARCVVMVGLPYPNARDPELVEKMAFLDKRQPGTGRAFYDSLCMKAVNQSIGRAIRHQRDYSTIVLIDHRYSSASIRKQLPEWIQHRVQPPAPFGQVYGQLAQFFRAKSSQ
ncbi:hypothetical protein Poli38472_000610 [Pythium oligandrum]|uniref:Helicase ATP-binding domain-containing protein n=1 Tax=Pythium oligandrum TaxID=41045 RepID=A0A8K1FJA8_PYTOL|nr:hypothetical protein Poli38472_000610 [Pythium oligandrum]|eukprot:TMW60568.1 hypothetical protein Poli38472_000610 [Pythium oligandrum]